MKEGQFQGTGLDLLNKMQHCNYELRFYPSFPFIKLQSSPEQCGATFLNHACRRP